MEPVWNERVLLSDKNLVVADLHIGYERELKEKGFNIPHQTQKMTDKISDILKKKKIEKLVINGDFKHQIPGSSWQEYNDIPNAVDDWLRYVDQIHLLPGNHDGGIDKYLPSEVIIHDSSGAVIDGVGYFHGHAIPSEEVISTGKVVTAHCHPSVTLIDSLNRKEKKECWVRLKYGRENGEGKAVIMPHFNHLLGGVSINEDGYLGPFLNNSNLSEEKIHLLDGTFLGDKEDLPEIQSEG